MAPRRTWDTRRSDELSWLWFGLLNRLLTPPPKSPLRDSSVTPARRSTRRIRQRGRGAAWTAAMTWWLTLASVSFSRPSPLRLPSHAHSQRSSRLQWTSIVAFSNSVSALTPHLRETSSHASLLTEAPCPQGRGDGFGWLPLVLGGECIARHWGVCIGPADRGAQNIHCLVRTASSLLLAVGQADALTLPLHRYTVAQLQ